MNEFEKHIRNNKYLFDDKTADKIKIWEAIDIELSTPTPKKIRSKRFYFMRVAASIAIVLGLYASSIQFFITNEQTHPIDNGLQDIDMHYSNLVSKQVNLVKNHPKLSYEDKEDFLSFMNELDEEYEILKTELNNNLNNELILEAIIKNYKQRIELIESLLKQINDSKKANDDYGYIL